MASLLCVVPDSPYTGLIGAIQYGHAQLGIGHFEPVVYPHTGRDSGVFKQADFIARSKRGRPPEKERYALALLDLEGCNAGTDRSRIESQIEVNLARVTFSECCCAVCVAPELEALYLAHPNSLAEFLDTDECIVRDWIQKAEDQHQRGFEERMLYVLRQHRKLTHEKISFREVVDCTDYTLWTVDDETPYGKLITTLRTWFPA